MVHNDGLHLARRDDKSVWRVVRSPTFAPVKVDGELICDSWVLGNIKDGVLITLFTPDLVADFEYYSE